MNKTMLGRQAIIIGSSLSGLLSASRLANHYEKVILIERDTLETGQRNGVPQGAHTHILLEKALDLLNGWFPDFEAALDLAQVPRIHWLKDVRMYHNGWLPRSAAGVLTRSATRPLLESIIRHLVLQNPTIELRTGSTAHKPQHNHHLKRVTGVRIEHNDQYEDLTSDLIIDSSGRGSRAAGWLADWGYGQVVKESIDAHLSYTSQAYQTLNTDSDWSLMRISSLPGGLPRGGLLTRTEQGWLLTLAGYGKGHHPPLTDFQAFADSLAHPAIGQAIRNGQPLGKSAISQSTANIRRRFDQLPQLPDGFLVMGDALAAFNPAYGQGIAVSALQAAQLEKMLPTRPTGHALQKALIHQTDSAWLMAVAADRQWLPNQAESNTERLARQWLQTVQADMLHDEKLRTLFIRTFNMQAPLERLFMPDVLMQVARTHLSRQN